MSNFSYCTRVHYIEVPEVWFCEPCEYKNATTSPCNVNQDVGLQAPKKQQTARSGKVKFLDEDEVIKLASGSFSITRKAYVHGKLQSNEAQKNQKTDQHASHPSSKGEIFFLHYRNPYSFMSFKQNTSSSKLFNWRLNFSGLQDDYGRLVW